jgi:hypothetical protein
MQWTYGNHSIIIAFHPSIMEGLIGGMDDANMSVMIRACNAPGSIIIDSARACNPYAMIGHIDIDNLHSVYVISAESVYRFRSAVRLLPLWIRKHAIRKVYATAVNAFYSYGNKWEDCSILDESYAMLSRIERYNDVKVCVSLPIEEPHHSIIIKYCTSIIRK